MVGREDIKSDCDSRLIIIAKREIVLLLLISYKTYKSQCEASEEWSRCREEKKEIEARFD